MALLRGQDGVRTEDEDRVGDLDRTGYTLSAEWDEGATGTETYARFRDRQPA